MTHPCTLADTLPLEDEAGDVVAKARSGLGLSHPTLAAELGVPVQALQAWEALAEAIPGNLAPILAERLDLKADALARLLAGNPGPGSLEEPADGWETCRFTLAPRDGAYSSNTWIVSHPERLEAWVIDPGYRPEVPLAWLRARGLTLKGILVTHGHRDHSGGAPWLAEQTGAPAWLHPADHELTAEGEDFAWQDPRRWQERAPFVTWSPGHTPGGCVWHVGIRTFVGDTMFASSIGRTFGGPANHSAHRDSVSRILGRGTDELILPGHGPASTVGRERECNPFSRWRDDSVRSWP
ncbi:MAG: MBL fold metallo-hydrolase [Candidatus Sericytochromatia bacterium]|nr:MBL fold metallo-hydrolase [Candidatus Sericytochromatia bacterium]